jgi:hypothetical protein
MRKLPLMVLMLASALACASCAGLLLYETSSAGRYPSSQIPDECADDSKECRSR